MKKTFWTMMGWIIASSASAIVVRPAQPQSIQPLHFEGGTPAQISLEIVAPTDAGVALRVTLFQNAHGLSAPLGDAIELGDFRPPPGQPVQISLPLPSVQAPTAVTARFQARTRPGDEFLPAGQIPLVVHPQGAMDELRHFTHQLRDEEGIRLGVFGPTPVLRDFLKKEHVDFIDLGEKPGELPQPKILAIGETGEPAEHGGQIVFTEAAELVPGVYETRCRDGLATKVTLPLLRNLATDPLARSTFLHILIRHHHAATVPAYP